MYRKQQLPKSNIKTDGGYIAETLEAKIRRMINNKEPLTDESPLLYTEREEGIKAAYDIRTDRFEIAVEAMDKVAQSKLTSREQRLAEKTYDTMNDQQKTEFHTKFPKSKIKPVAISSPGEPAK